MILFTFVTCLLGNAWNLLSTIWFDWHDWRAWCVQSMTLASFTVLIFRSGSKTAARDGESMKSRINQLHTSLVPWGQTTVTSCCRRFPSRCPLFSHQFIKRLSSHGVQSTLRLQPAALWSRPGARFDQTFSAGIPITRLLLHKLTAWLSTHEIHL